MQLSVYIGLRAIGWLVHNETKVVQYGIKRVNVPFDHYYEYLTGQPVTARINRRIKRQARRNLWRYKSRRDNLLFLLKNTFKVSPKQCSREQMLQWRVDCLNQPMSHEVLVTVLMNLQRRRGYKSQRGVSDNENSDYLKEIERHEAELSKYRSIAEYLQTLPSSTNIIFNRQSYINEFNAIMDVQEVDAGLRQKIDNLLYFQNPLKKGKVAKCRYEPNREVMPASHPLFQEFRCWRDVLNIIIWDVKKNELDIPQALREKWFTKLMAGQSITKASCLKDMGIKKPSAYTWLSGKQIAGNALTSLFNSAGFAADMVFTETLWQELYSATDSDKLAAFLQKKYGFSEPVIEALIDADFSKLGHAEYSAKAVRKLLPLLQQGVKLKEAVLQVYGKVDFTTVALRNQILERHFGAYQSLVTALKSKYPEIGGIKFEIDPLLKKGNKQRKALAQAKRKDEKAVKEHGRLFKSGTDSYNAKKLRLWQESKGVSPYEPGVKIPLEELFTDKYNLDHLVPKSKLMESGENNLVLCRAELNEQKGNRFTGIEFAEKLGIVNEYLQVLDTLPEQKQQYGKMRLEDVPTNAVSSRQNSDYNTQCFATVGNGLNIPNKVINKFIQQWNVPAYNENDARYALAKAYVLANFSQDTITYLDNIAKAWVKPYALSPNLPAINISDAPIAMQRIKFTRKTKYGYTPRFALHGESVHGKRVKTFRNAKGELQEEVYYKIRQPITKLTPAMVEKVMDKALMRKIQQRIAEVGSHEEGILSTIERPILHGGNKVRAASVAVNAEKIYPLHSTNMGGKTGPKNKFGTPTDYVFSDKTHRLVIDTNGMNKITKDAQPLILFIDGINKGESMRNTGVELQERNVVLLDGKKYFVIGAGESLAIRPCYTLSATDTRKVKAEDWPKMQKLLVNQLGEVKHSINILPTPAAK